jgi:hypothetical protein
MQKRLKAKLEGLQQQINAQIDTINEQTDIIHAQADEINAQKESIIQIEIKLGLRN